MENDVAATARITASIRARETARPDGLFRDLLAEVLAGHEAMAAMQAMPETVRDRSSMYTVIRTRVFDDWLSTTLGARPKSPLQQANTALIKLRSTDGLEGRPESRMQHPAAPLGPGSGVAQVVLLGAGFDTRAFRLDWPPGVRLWELDQVSLLAAKEAILARVAAIPGCQRSSVPVDLADAGWPGALKSAGLHPEAPTAWLAEGLLPYLAPDVAVGMLDAVRELSPPGSHFAMDLVDQVSVSTRNQYLAGLRQLSPALKGASFQFGTDDPRQLLADHGWTTSRIMHPGDEGANFGRFTTFPDMPGLPLPLLSFVLASRS